MQTLVSNRQLFSCPSLRLTKIIVNCGSSRPCLLFFFSFFYSSFHPLLVCLLIGFLLGLVSHCEHLDLPPPLPLPFISPILPPTLPPITSLPLPTLISSCIGFFLFLGLDSNFFSLWEERERKKNGQKKYNSLGSLHVYVNLTSCPRCPPTHSPVNPPSPCLPKSPLGYFYCLYPPSICYQLPRERQSYSPGL